ncbi:MAG: hypothetical protein P4L51_01770 [Puia sp.]|nr:hypothetical protein [Puia sp.]
MILTDKQKIDRLEALIFQMGSIIRGFDEDGAYIEFWLNDGSPLLEGDSPHLGYVPALNEIYRTVEGTK